MLVKSDLTEHDAMLLLTCTTIFLKRLKALIQRHGVTTQTTRAFVTYDSRMINYIYIYIYYWFETWSLTMREECRLWVFERRVLRRIFGPKRDEVKRGVEKTT